MPKSPFPNALDMRRLKFGVGGTDAERDRVAAALRAAGRLEEAVLLYESRPTHPDVARDLETATREGRAFLVFLLRRMGAEVTDAHVRACAAAAEAAGRFLDAHRCYTALADAEALARIAPNLPGFKIAVPANKV
jgi:hypothetical protein